ncbi:MAG: SEC-C metal-binding domain-containing protein [Candidatus Limnocylindrales bacterium]
MAILLVPALRFQAESDADRWRLLSVRPIASSALLAEGRPQQTDSPISATPPLLSSRQVSGGEGYPSETRVRRGFRVVHGDKELAEKLDRNDLCPCGSALRFQELLHALGRLRRQRAGRLLALDPNCRPRGHPGPAYPPRARQDDKPARATQFRGVA